MVSIAILFYPGFGLAPHEYSVGVGEKVFLIGRGDQTVDLRAVRNV